VSEDDGSRVDTVSRRRPRGRRAVIMSLVPVLAVAGLFGSQLGKDPTRLPNLLEGRAAPDFRLSELQGGREIRLSAQRGHPVVINFWASWCAECAQEHDDLTAAWSRFSDQGVTFLGILYQDTPSGARAFIRDFGGGWPTLLDPGSRTALDYGVYGAPETFFISADGTVIHKQVGPSTYGVLASWIERLLRSEHGRST
jgi:cytochrome c biogenesis protein CcmG/thiol:disulfide interchange protein DsbE